MADATDAPDLSDLAADLSAETDVKSEAVETQETTPAEPSTEETKTPETEAPAQPETPAAEEAEKPEDAAETTEEETQSAADKRKAELAADIDEGKQQLGIDPNTEIRDMVSARKAIREAVSAKNAQVYAPQTPEEIMAETGQSAQDARITAMEQRQELADYNERVAEAQLVIQSESQRVMQDFPMFNPSSPDFRPEVANQAAELLKSNLQFDQNTGELVGSSISTYQLYKTIASANQASAVENQIKGQRSAEQMLAAAEPQSSAVPAQPKEDPFLKGLLGGNYAQRAGSK